MKKWNSKIRPSFDVCPEHYCFNWVAPRGKADLSGQAYDSFEAAVDTNKNTVAFLHGGCGSSFGSCVRSTHESKDSDWYEPCESVLRKSNLPELFFCNPENLDDEFSGDYKKMASELWGRNA